LNAFAVEGLEDTKFHNLELEIVGYDEETYGIYTGPAYTGVFAFLLLFTGALADRYSRKNILLLSMFFWSAVTAANYFVNDMTTFIILRSMLGFFHAFFPSASYGLVSDYFPPEKRTFAFSVYAILIQLGDSISSLTINLIVYTGWRLAFVVCGGLGAVTSILGACFMIEPSRDQVA